MPLLVTRPQPQADAWVADLRAAGLDAAALPLIAIEGPADPEPVRALWHGLAAHRLLMFVSPAAVQWFFALRPPEARWPATCLAATPGPGTARSLQAAGAPSGLTPQQILTPPSQASQFDSEHLWPVLAPLDWAGQHVAILGGGDQSDVKGRTWLAEQLRARGATVTPVLAYQRGPGTWQAHEQALARAALAQPATHQWLFSSSQAIDHLIAHHLPAWSLPVPDWAAHQALVTHPKIAEHARRAGFGHLVQTRPTLEAVVQARRTAA